MKNGRNKGQSRASMKDRNRPKIRIDTKDEYPGGLTPQEIETWCDRISTIRTARMTDVFKPEVSQWPDST